MLGLVSVQKGPFLSIAVFLLEFALRLPRAISLFLSQLLIKWGMSSQFFILCDSTQVVKRD